MSSGRKGRNVTCFEQQNGWESSMSAIRRFYSLPTRMSRSLDFLWQWQPHCSVVIPLVGISLFEGIMFTPQPGSFTTSIVVRLSDITV